ncbi:MAG: sulfite exporter TauE/SafE family protein [Candidatus Heimdallarchaeaceae archaeon]
MSDKTLFKKQLLFKYLPVTILLIVIGIIELLSILLNFNRPQDAPELTWFLIIILLIVGITAGFLGGIIGTGGCSVMLPILHFWLGFPAPLAVGTTLFAVIFTAISGGYGHLIRKNVDKRASIILGLSGIAGVALGSWLFTMLTGENTVRYLSLILGIVFIWPAIRMTWEGIRGKIIDKKGSTEIKTETKEQVIKGSVKWLSVFGFIIGITTGLIGLGGGYALVPGLIYLFGAPVYITMGTSLAIMIPLALTGGLIKLFQGYVVLDAALLLAAGTIIGAQIGSAVIKKFRPYYLKLIFGLYFVYVSLKFIFSFFGLRIW